MVGIIIYTTKEKFRHKKNVKNAVCYWELKRMPKRFEQDEDFIFFAYEGYIRGYFDPSLGGRTLYQGPDLPKKCIQWDPTNWIDLDVEIAIKSFQGFKYADNEDNLMELFASETL